MRYGKHFEINGLVNYIGKNIDELQTDIINDPQLALNKIAEHSPGDIGTVYIITLLYFISKGRYPIYDRFAAIPLEAIKQDKKPGDIIKYKELPSIKDRKFRCLMKNGMAEYMKRLETFLGADYWKNQDVDRVLWVYGHYFLQK